MGNLTAAAVGPQGQLYQTSGISNIANHPWTQINPVTQAALPPVPPPTTPVKLNQISYSSGRICGIDFSDNIWCNSVGSPNNFTKVPNGQLKNISLYGNSAMGTNSANQIWYTQNIFAASPTWYLLSGNLNTVSQSNLMACGLDQNQKVWCNIPGGPYNNHPNFSMASEQLQDLSVYGYSGYGIGVGGNSVYYKTQGSVDTAPWQPYCNPNSVNTCPGKLPLKNISQASNMVCVTDSQNNIYCQSIAQNGQASNSWTQVSGVSSQVILDNSAS